jgi:hypothetical protein
MSILVCGVLMKFQCLKFDEIEGSPGPPESPEYAHALTLHHGAVAVLILSAIKIEAKSLVALQ